MKYYCDYCEKSVQGSRKLHSNSKLHQRNKRFYLKTNEGTYFIGEWEEVFTQEQEAYYKFLNAKLKSKYFKLKHWI